MWLEFPFSNVAHKHDSSTKVDKSFFRETPCNKIQTFKLPGSGRRNDVLRQHSGLFIELKLRAWEPHQLSKSKNREKTVWPGVTTSCLISGIGNISQVITLMFWHYCNFETRFKLKRSTSKTNLILVQLNSLLSDNFQTICLKIYKQKSSAF